MIPASYMLKYLATAALISIALSAIAQEPADYVPFGCSKAYKASEKWNIFKIEEMPEDKWREMIP